MGFKEGLYMCLSSVTMETKMQFDCYSRPSPPLVQNYIMGSLLERFSSSYMLWPCIFFPLCIFVFEIACIQGWVAKKSAAFMLFYFKYGWTEI